jgi:hypothetical protein
MSRPGPGHRRRDDTVAACSATGGTASRGVPGDEVQRGGRPRSVGRPGPATRRGLGGGRGLAVGGGGLGLVGVVVLVFFQLLGGGGTGGTGAGAGGALGQLGGQLGGLGEGQTADNGQLEQQCRTGADANASVECAVVADIESI